MKKVICLLILLPLIIIGQTQQYSYGPYNADLKASVWENYSGTPIHDGSLTETNYIGFEWNYKIWRNIYQWDLSNVVLPEGAKFNKVIITYKYHQKIVDTPNSLGLMIYDVYDALKLAGQNNWSALYYGMTNNSVNGEYLGQNWGDEDSLLIYEGTGTTWDTLITNRIASSGQLTLGFSAFYEDYKNTNKISRSFLLHSDYVTLKIVFDLPVQDIVVRQKLSNGTEFGQIGHWENNSWINYSTGDTLSFGINNTEYLQAETNINSNEKFNNWNTTYSYLNFLSFTVENG